MTRGQTLTLAFMGSVVLCIAAAIAYLLFKPQPAQTPGLVVTPIQSPQILIQLTAPISQTALPTLTPEVPGFSIIHNFASGQNNGRVPYSSVVYHNGYFYGATTYGGAPYDVPPANPDNKGNVYRIKPDGTDFTVLHEFTGGDNDGWKPWSGLVVTDSKIYGSTVYGGKHGEEGGTLYEMNLDGSEFKLLHSFGEPNDGYGASTSPILVDDTLYGMTRWGGLRMGAIYRYNLTLGTYDVIYRFPDTEKVPARNGRSPYGGLTYIGDGYLYGLTWEGGEYNYGVLFRIKPDGSDFKVLHHFEGKVRGKYPYDNLVFDGANSLYGTTFGEYGKDSSDYGVLFKYDLQTEEYSVLHVFAGGLSDSGKPNGSVVIAPDGLIYGSTHGDSYWGGAEYGMLYRINPDGTGFTPLHEFIGGLFGNTPMHTPILLDGVLYGTTAYGGTEDYGTIYKYVLP